MFERELIDAASFIDRWGIVRTVKQQSIGEHMYLVAHYANDISTILGLPPRTNLAILQYALWHDVDEIFSADLPGPNKRVLLDEKGKKRWDMVLAGWMHKTFEMLYERNGTAYADRNHSLIKKVVKAADWLEAATRMATEDQLGNKCTGRHVVPNLNGAIEVMKSIATECPEKAKACEEVMVQMQTAVLDARDGQSAGPWITREDETRDKA